MRAGGRRRDHEASAPLASGFRRRYCIGHQAAGIIVETLDGFAKFDSPTHSGTTIKRRIAN
jgi:hypothetical protein